MNNINKTVDNNELTEEELYEVKVQVFCRYEAEDFYRHMKPFQPALCDKLDDETIMRFFGDDKIGEDLLTATASAVLNGFRKTDKVEMKDNMLHVFEGRHEWVFIPHSDISVAYFQSKLLSEYCEDYEQHYLTDDHTIVLNGELDGDKAMAVLSTFGGEIADDANLVWRTNPRGKLRKLARDLGEEEEMSVTACATSGYHIHQSKGLLLI